MSFTDGPECWEVESSLCEAKEVYVLMQNNYRISRNIRAQWFFKNLNKNLTLKWKTSQEKLTYEIEVISAIPKYAEKFEVDDVTNSSTIRIVADTKVNFLSTQYRLAFCLDLSPSVATIDIQHNNIYFEDIYSSLEQSLTSVSEPFYIPGSNYYFRPQIYITVIAHIPNCPIVAPQVLIQGWILTPDNRNELLELIQNKLKNMCKIVEKVSSTVQEEQIQFMMPHDAAGAILDGTIDGNKMIKKVLDLSADINTLKLIRYGILALQLLPENSSAGIIVITDGIVSFPNCRSLDALLVQLRNSTIACSFLQLGSPFHPFACFGRVPYKELMEFIATATCGAYFPASRNIVIQNSESSEINAYHRALLLWNFQKTSTSCFLEAYEPSHKKDDYWHVENHYFYTVKYQSRVTKKHTEGTLKVSLENLLSCRLREGYTVKSIIVDEAKNLTEVRLVLPWMLSTNIEYLVTSGPGRQWKSTSADISNCHFEVIVDGCYEFLHDVTCSEKKPIKSIYRKTVIAQFWSYIKNLSNTDQILTQLHSFAHNPVYYTIPENIKNGVPLFYFAPNSSLPVLSSKNVANLQFTAFWKPLSMLDINVWQKWMHAHRIGVILQHDMPLPNNLHLPNSSGRYVNVQCRQATAALNSLLSEHCSFVLVENHSYIKLLFDEADKPPTSFYVIRVTSKPPCVVIRLAFLGGLPGLLRYEIVNDLREKILNLKLTKRAATKDYSQSTSNQSSSSSPEACCCFFLKKPVEKILIRYEKLPSNFLISVPDAPFGARGVPLSQKISDAYLCADALVTLSKYLQQQRWIWTLQYEPNTSLQLTSASKILYTLTNIRLQEGFHFSHSAFGIIYMVQEIPVQVPKARTSEAESDFEMEENFCVVQYIMFPPHTNTTLKDSISEEDDTELTEADGELQLITECWVEPQYGISVLPSKLNYLNGLTFEEISQAIKQKDFETITVLTTFEHLCHVCQKSAELLHQSISLQDKCVSHFSADKPTISLANFENTEANEGAILSNTFTIPYCFNLLSVLPKSSQTEIVFSTLHEVRDEAKETKPNAILFDFLMENLKLVHDLDIDLSLQDSWNYLMHIHHRERDASSVSPVPFPHPNFHIADFSLKQNYSDMSKCKECKICLNHVSLDASDSSQQPLLEQQFRENLISKWKCFVKGYKPTQVVLTFIPSSYQDLEKLFLQNSNLKLHLDSPEGSKVNIIYGDEDVSLNVDETGISKPSESFDISGSSVQDNVFEPVESSHELSYNLPVYVYNCVSSSIINQLVQLEQCEKIKDTYEKHIFQYDQLSEENPDLSLEKRLSPIKSPDNSPDGRKCKKDCDNSLLKEHCALLDKSYSKSFVYGVYRLLMLGLDVRKFDAVAAIDEICEESLLEVDITEFVFMICGHVKDFTMKHSVRHMHLTRDSDEDKASNEDKPEDANFGLEKIPEKCLFPLSLLQKHQPCEELQQKHLNIKDKFLDIIQSYFKVIPSRPDYFFFNPADEEMEEPSLKLENEDSQEEDGLESVVNFGDDYVDGELDRTDNMCEDDGSAKSCLNTASSLSSIEKDTDHISLQDKNVHPPLFVHFSCSVRSSKQQMKSCPLNESSLPTCLNDIINCLDSESNEVNLDDLRITLDITCLSVPDDIESPEVSRNRVYTTSFSSSSPVPEAEYYRRQHINDEENESSCSDIATDTIQVNSLQNLPSFQREAVHKCIGKINWLLQDEKASVALNSFPITSEILDMVINHVKSSDDKPCCIIKEIPLMFVYGPETSLDKFIQAFKRMSPVGYRLNEVNGTYYLVLDAESARKLNHPFGSLDPPLGIVDKYQIIKSNPHSDDCTELKRIGEEIKDTPVFAGKEFSYHPDGESLNDDFKSSNLNNDTVFSFLREKGFHKVQQDEDSETEDGNDTQRPKNKFNRKTSMKRFSSSVKKRTISSTSLIDFERKYSLGERPHTAPPKVSLLDSNQYEEISDWDASALKENQSQSVNLRDWCSEVRASSPLDDSSPDPSLESKDVHLVSSAISVGRFKPPDSIGSPVVCSEAEFGSFHFSNTEDGYDGDSSDSGGDCGWLSTLDTRRPVLPNFWLIMNVCEKKVIVYFHMRQRNEDDEELGECQTVLNEVVTIIKNICKEVNQILLLQSLSETRMCDRLLVPEGNDDVWKSKDFDLIGDPNRTVSSEDPDLALEVHEKYLEATLKFEPGAFGCPVVWVTHFKLHHRLAAASTGSIKSLGIQALRSVLNTFSVNNRENMFVYQDGSGPVFYLRLFEEICGGNHSGGISRVEDNLSLMGSYCSSVQSLPQKRTNIESDFEMEFRPRVNSGASDSYRQDALSIASSKKPQKCVALYVHGIGEVGTTITNDLVQVLQNRLNEGVLDLIIMMLSRNPQCMLTPEDVQFIQNPNSPPTQEIHFTLPVKLLGYAHSVHIYLRQNMLHFVYNPKYTDSRKESHFKAYSYNPVEWTQVDDNDIFLYHSHQASGYSGGKGISCIVLSLVTGSGTPFQNLNNLSPNPSAYQDGLSENEFKDLTCTSVYTVKKDKSPGPVALIRFQIWSVGKDVKQQIELKLENAVRHALWDLLMEYCALTSPISDSAYLDDSSCYSEPTTPIRTRRTGLSTVDPNLQLKDFHSSVGLQISKEMSSSVPDITVKAHSPPSLKEIPAFKFGNGPQSAKPEFHTEGSNQAKQITPSSSTTKSDKKNLNYMFHTLLEPFLQYGDKLGCPALSRGTFTLSSRHSVIIVLKEIQTIIKNILRDIFPKVYLQINDPLTSEIEYIPFNPYTNTTLDDPEDRKPGSVKSFIIIGRNEKQWRAYMGHSDFLKFHESSVESIKTYQKYQTHVCTRQNLDTFQESGLNSPTHANKSITSASPHQKSSAAYTSDRSSKSAVYSSFVPRQRLFRMYVQDKEITLFLYNWSSEISQNLLSQLTKLVKWHQQRNCLLNNIILQKLGVFHGLSSLQRASAEKSTKADKSKSVRESPDDSVKLSYIEQLISNHNFSKESHSTSSKSSTVSLKPVYVSKSLKNARPIIPFHLSSSADVKDPVKAHGTQFLETISAQRRDMQVLYNMWQTRGSSVIYPFDRVFLELKRLARLSHYCFTPILFSPSWRWRVAPIRDHALEPLEQLYSSERLSDSLTTSRSRHSSGSSLKNSDGSSTASRSRRVSGVTYPGSNQGSPRMRTKTPSEETWHSTVCRHYLQEYVQYLHTVGFVSLQTSDTSSGQSRRSVSSEDDKLSRSDSFSHHRNSIAWPPVFYLIKCLLGGLLVFELGIIEPYAYGHLYSLECSRFNACSPRTLNSQFTAAFLDELDKVKLNMHLHSFTYDYHLRTIHSYISGRQLIFRHGYHLTSFLDDFIKYYQKVPNGARNLLYAGSLTIPDINMSGDQLYNYIISHNQLYGMTVLRMVPVVMDSTSSIDTEFALVELSAQKASYKDLNDVCQMGSFDVGLLINHNTSEPVTDPNSLVLSFYIILTSQRDLYPKLSNLGSMLGSFQTVRFGSALTSSGYSSRKTSTASMLTEKEKLESSGEDSVNSADSKSKKTSVVRSMCDEDVMYLGYYSSQETMMQQVLNQQAEAARCHLEGIVQRASIHCRRDSLWSSLLPRTLKEENSSKDHGASAASSYADFSELLELVTMIPLNGIDEKLTPFMNMHISWYVTLAPVLKSKYADSHREFMSSDGSSMYVVVTNFRCPDSFLLLSIDARANRTDLCLVFREPPTDIEHTAEKPNQRTLALQSLVEDFVNACCFHLWTCLL